MLRRLDPGPIGGEVAFSFEGRTLAAPAGSSVAAALLAEGVDWFRCAPKSGAHRAPFCMMGACFDCALVIDGRPNRQACLTRVAAGMRIEREAPR
jgi:D-hydroxyproline dehydrogenase subunit gamma